MIAAVASNKVGTQAALAEALGIVDRTVRHYLARGMPGTDSRGKYNVERCRSWVAANIREREEVATDDLHEALKRAELGKTEAQRKKIEMENAVKAGKLIDKAETELGLSEAFAIAAAQIQGIPDEMEMLIPLDFRADLKREFENRIYLILKRLARCQEVSQ